jgi:Zn-dependent peptidase ImmA (M78 family)
MGGPYPIHNAAMDRVVNAAHEARAALGAAATGPLPDVLALVEEGHGVPVGVVALGPGLAGAYLRRPRGALILLNGADAAPRLRFTLAHELGHHVLAHEQSVDTHAALDRPARAIEVQANRFAAELLVPVPAVRAWLAGRDAPAVGLDDVVELAARFGISAPAALFRLQAAGALGDRERAARIRAEIDDNAHLDLRHRRRLPDLDDGLARARERMPRVRPGSALDAYARGTLGAERLAAVVRATLADVQATMRAADLEPR